MSRRRRLILGFASVGLAVAGVLFAYLEITNYATLNRGLLWASIIFCPSSLLSVGFIDAEPHSAGIAIVWLVIGLVNSALYGAIGAVIGKYLWK